MNQEPGIYDVVVVGGGINGAGIAADAAGRGLRVALCEQGDLAGATSSASTKLVHGGLRYLETYEFRLVRKALKESELLLELAPHLIQPISIHIPYMAHHRPWLLIRLGLLLYNNLAPRPSYKKARSINFDPDSPLIKELTRGFIFSDGQVDDARLVILNAMQAARDSADVFVHHQCLAMSSVNGCWELTLRNQLQGSEKVLRSRTVVNATGPWVNQFVENVVKAKPRKTVRLVKGSHIIVPSIQPPDRAFLLQNKDGRVVFVIPYKQDYSLIGTTEEEFTGDPYNAKISTQETEYLIKVVNSYFRQPISKEDITHTYAGIRPLVGEKNQSATKASRDYRLEFENTSLPLLSVYGGKVTTYRILAEQAVEKLGKYLGNISESKTSKQKLPGGNIESRDKLFDSLMSEYPWLPVEIAKRWVGSYGSISFDLLAGTKGRDDLGLDFGYGLTQKEVDYLIREEWATSVEDILWRRTKLGLEFDKTQIARLNQYLLDKLTG